MAGLRWAWRVGMGEEPQSTPGAFGAAFERWLAGHAASHVGFIAEVDGDVVGIAFLAIVERVPGPSSRSPPTASHGGALLVGADAEWLTSEDLLAALGDGLQQAMT